LAGGRSFGTAWLFSAEPKKAPPWFWYAPVPLFRASRLSPWPFAPRSPTVAARFPSVGFGRRLCALGRCICRLYRRGAGAQAGIRPRGAPPSKLNCCPASPPLLVSQFRGGIRFCCWPRLFRLATSIIASNCPKVVPKCPNLGIYYVQTRNCSAGPRLRVSPFSAIIRAARCANTPASLRARGPRRCTAGHTHCLSPSRPYTAFRTTVGPS
jgi:hypothetical protein